MDNLYALDTLKRHDEILFLSRKHKISPIEQYHVQVHVVCNCVRICYIAVCQTCTYIYNRKEDATKRCRSREERREESEDNQCVGKTALTLRLVFVLHQQHPHPGEERRGEEKREEKRGCSAVMHDCTLSFDPPSLRMLLNLCSSSSLLSWCFSLPLQAK